MTEFMTWLVFSGAVCYARKHDIMKRYSNESTEIWEHIWRMQRAMGYTPVGLIRSC